MRIDSINIVNFKNIEEAQLDFSPNVNCLLGNNGMGKSNLLEAIYFLSMARALSPGPETSLLRYGSDIMFVKGELTTDGDAHADVACGITRGKGKSLKYNGKEYQRISEHIGKMPVVVVSPSDSMIITGGAEMRRRFMDMVISQSDPSYLLELIRYNKALESRNKMLKAGLHDPLLYESVEMTLEASAMAVYNRRKEWAEKIQPILAKYYSCIADNGETASLRYESALAKAPLRELLNARRAKDEALGFTTVGVHRDELLTLLGNHNMRIAGSQGQIKTFAIALRLAIFNYMRNAAIPMPILLLDDIFDKLDARRVAKIMELVADNGNFGQIFITDTNRKHLDEILAPLDEECKLFEVSEGHFTEIKG